MMTVTKAELPPRDYKGRFIRLVCVNAHDRCYGGAGGPCPWCEPTHALAAAIAASKEL